MTQMSAREVQVTLTTDESGDVVALTDEIFGYIHRIYVDLGTLTSGAADLVIAEDADPGLTIVTLTNMSADAILTPVVPVTGATGAAIADAYAQPFINGRRLRLTVAGGGDELTGAVRVLVTPFPTGFVMPQTAV